MKGKRTTIVLDNDIDKKLRFLQAKRIQNEQLSISYSRVINDLIRKSLSKK